MSSDYYFDDYDIDEAQKQAAVAARGTAAGAATPALEGQTTWNSPGAIRVIQDLDESVDDNTSLTTT